MWVPRTGDEVRKQYRNRHTGPTGRAGMVVSFPCLQVALAAVSTLRALPTSAPAGQALRPWTRCGHG